MAKNDDADKKQSKQDEKEKRRRRKRIWRKVRKWMGIGILALIAFLFIILSLYWFPADLHYKFTETYTFTSEEQAAVNLVILLPTSGPYQTITEPQVTWPGDWDAQADGQLSIIRLSSKIGAGETVKALVSYQVNLFQGQVAWIGEPIQSTYLQSSADIPSDSPELAAQAAALKVEYNDRETVENALTWINKNLTLSAGSNQRVNQNALDAFTTGNADSIGFANLFAALCRAEDIPSRTVTGRVIPDLFPLIPMTWTKNNPLAFQAWNEIFVQDEWQLADASRSGSFLSHDLLGWTDGQHLAYDEKVTVDAVYQALIMDAEEESGWSAGGTEPLKFMAWSDTEARSLTVTPSLSIRKVWDGRWVMMISLLLILFIITWLTRQDRYGSKSNSKNTDHEK